jgi:hypothetical protein
MILNQIDNIKAVVSEFVFPTVMMWNRIEGRPRARKNFDRALKAEVRDPLWMLTKQWQMGEFEGDDAGSPVLAKVRMDTSMLTRYQADSHLPQDFPQELALEAQVEQKSLPFSLDKQKISLDLRLLMGRRWKQILAANDPANPYYAFTLKHFAFALPDPTKAEDAYICAHPDAWQQAMSVAGRMVDGAELYFYLKKGDRLIDLPDGNLLPGEPATAVTDYLEWFEQLFLQPVDPEDNAWMPSHLEYQFACSAPQPQGEKVYSAQEYYHGHLDWYNLDVDPGIKTLHDVNEGPDQTVLGKTVKTMLPTPVMFDGMPNTRWWAFENNRVNYSYIKPNTQELSKLLFLEFGLVYANDWFLIPYELPVGTLAEIKGMAVTNVFGENIWIDASGRGGDEDWDRWNMFSINVKGKENVPADLTMLLLPSVPKIQEGQPIEEVTFIRDEMANMVWGIETRVPLFSGSAVAGSGAAAQYRAYLQGLIPPPAPGPAPTETDAKIRYEVMNEVPEHWIPFIPAHVENSIHEVQLQRAAMPRFLKNDPAKPVKIRPRTTLLQEGLVKKQAYYIHEEEIPRAGAQVYQSYQRSRWRDGRVMVWFGTRKTTGRGEGSSGLAFDRIVENRKNE